MEYKEIHPESMLIPTLQNCKDLVNENNSPFVMFTDTINGHNIYTFNYRYAYHYGNSLITAKIFLPMKVSLNHGVNLSI